MELEDGCQPLILGPTFAWVKGQVVHISHGCLSLQDSLKGAVQSPTEMWNWGTYLPPAEVCSSRDIVNIIVYSQEAIYCQLKSYYFRLMLLIWILFVLQTLVSINLFWFYRAISIRGTYVILCSHIFKSHNKTDLCQMKRDGRAFDFNGTLHSTVLQFETPV